MEELIESRKGSLCRYKLPPGAIAQPADLLDLLMNCPVDTVIVDREALTPDFFDLKTRVAGEFLQKVVNYRKRMVILGPYANPQSKSWNDFTYESNRAGKVVFAETVELAIELLK